MGFISKLFGKKKGSEHHFADKPKCDVCDNSLNSSDGYVLTTEQVVLTTTYWEYVLNNQYSSLRSTENKEILFSLINQQSRQSLGWLICNICSSLFVFDKTKAKEYALKKMSPPNSGPVTPEKAAVYAFAAKNKLVKN